MAKEKNIGNKIMYSNLSNNSEEKQIANNYCMHF